MDGTVACYKQVPKYSTGCRERKKKKKKEQASEKEGEGEREREREKERGQCPFNHTSASSVTHSKPF